MRMQVEPRHSLGPRQAPLLFIGQSKPAKRILTFADAVAGRNDAVLLCGETGTGKDSVARRIHDLEPSRRKFVAVNCGNLPSDLAATELFGHTGSAFTGAVKPKIGLIQDAEYGTLFLNEVTNMLLDIQAKFLDLFDGKPIRKIGSTVDVECKTRIIVATNSNLEEKVERGELREDLYYRIRRNIFTMPTLRERRDDIPLFVKHFLDREESARELAPKAQQTIMDHSWPGNVRELADVLAGANLQAHIQGAREIQLEHVESCLTNLTKAKERVEPRVQTQLVGESTGDLPTLQDVEKKYLTEVLSFTGGNVVMATQIADIARSHMYKKISNYGLESLVSSARED